MHGHLECLPVQIEPLQADDVGWATHSICGGQLLAMGASGSIRESLATNYVGRACVVSQSLFSEDGTQVVRIVAFGGVEDKFVLNLQYYDK